MKADFYAVIDWACECVVIFKTKDEAEEFLRKECHDNRDDYDIIDGHFGECIFI